MQNWSTSISPAQVNSTLNEVLAKTVNTGYCLFTRRDEQNLASFCEKARRSFCIKPYIRVAITESKVDGRIWILNSVTQSSAFNTL